MAIYDVELFEPAQSPWTADSDVVTADSTIFTADGGPLVTPNEVVDGQVNVVEAELHEPAQSLWTADSIVVTADSTIFTADGGPLTTPDEIVDAEVISVPAVVGADFLPRRRIVEGDGYGILPPLRGEGHGVVYLAVGSGSGALPKLTGAAHGIVDDLELELLMLTLLLDEAA
jgi:hypothetical protein